MQKRSPCLLTSLLPRRAESSKSGSIELAEVPVEFHQAANGSLSYGLAELVPPSGLLPRNRYESGWPFPLHRVGDGARVRDPQPQTAASTPLPRLWRAAACACLMFSLLLPTGCGRQEIEVVRPQSKPIQESFSEPAKTRLRRTYPVTMPVSARIDRIDLEPGDVVEAGASLVSFDRLPLEQNVAEARAAVAEFQARIRVQEDHRLEETAKVQVEAMINTALETLKAAKAQVEATTVRSDRAQRERARIERLAKEQTVSASTVEDAVVSAETSLIELRQQEFFRSAMEFMVVGIRLGPRLIDEWLEQKALQTDVLTQQLAQAKARLRRAEHELARASIVSPIRGVVLERYEQGDASLPAGQALLLLGSLSDLEVVAEVLTQDAVRLETGAEVQLESARGAPLAGHVDHIEPAGFTKLSSLGVEQQRVRVIVGFDSPADNLGVGYRLQARFLTGRNDDALVLPRFSILQDVKGHYYVLTVEENRVQRRPVEVGLRSDLEMEIVSGLAPDDLVVATPDTTLEVGSRVSARLAKPERTGTP